MKNCCSNCEWSISAEDEDNILRDMGYKEDDENRPHAGDCCLGMENKRIDYYCDNHIYNSSLSFEKEEEIVNDSFHQFIYSYEGNARDVFIDELSEKYKIVTNQNKPICIKIDNYMINNNYIDNKLAILEYLNFLIALSITKNLKDCEEFDNDEILLKKINRIFLNDKYDYIKNIDELISCLIESLSFYKDYYNNKVSVKIDEIKIPFIDIQTYIRIIKKCINNDSYFALLFNIRKDVPFIICNSLNNYISSRINKDISIKVFCDVNDYKSVYDLNHNIIENIHDYKIVELDDNYSDTLKLVRGKYENY